MSSIQSLRKTSYLLISARHGYRTGLNTRQKLSFVAVPVLKYCYSYIFRSKGEIFNLSL